MALFTTTDRDAVKTALMTAIASGVESVQLPGHGAKSWSISELRKLLAEIQAELTGDTTTSSETRMGLRMVKTVPPEAG